MNRRSFFALIAAVFAPKPKPPAPWEKFAAAPQPGRAFLRPRSFGWACIKVSAADVQFLESRQFYIGAIERQTRLTFDELLNELKAAGVRPS